MCVYIHIYNIYKIGICNIYRKDMHFYSVPKANKMVGHILPLKNHSVHFVHEEEIYFQVVYQ